MNLPLTVTPLQAYDAFERLRHFAIQASDCHPDWPANAVVAWEQAASERLYWKGCAEQLAAVVRKVGTVAAEDVETIRAAEEALARFERLGGAK